MTNDQIETKFENLVTLLQLKGDSYALGYLISFVKSSAYFMGENEVNNFSIRLDTHITELIQGLKNEKFNGKIPV